MSEWHERLWTWPKVGSDGLQVPQTRRIPCPMVDARRLGPEYDVTSCTCICLQYLAELGKSERRPIIPSATTTIPPAMSLLQDLLRTQTIDSLDKALSSGRTTPDDDDELINVVSISIPVVSNPRHHI